MQVEPVVPPRPKIPSCQNELFGVGVWYNAQDFTLVRRRRSLAGSQPIEPSPSTFQNLSVQAEKFQSRGLSGPGLSLRGLTVSSYWDMSRGFDHPGWLSWAAANTDLYQKVFCKDVWWCESRNILRPIYHH